MKIEMQLAQHMKRKKKTYLKFLGILFGKLNQNGVENFSFVHKNWTYLWDLLIGLRRKAVFRLLISLSQLEEADLETRLGCSP